MALAKPILDTRSELWALSHALLVPVLVMLAQSAWVVWRGWSMRNTLLYSVVHPVVFLGMGSLGALSVFILRAFVRRPQGRWVAFVCCVLGFTTLIEFFMPKLAE